MASNRPRPGPAGRDGQGREPQPVKLWTWPKIVFLYPSMIAAALAAVATALWPGQAVTWGIVFLVVFFANAIVMAFDFPRTSSLNLLLLVVAAVLAGVLINLHVVVFWPALQEWTERLVPTASTQFYAIFAGILAVVYLVVLIVDFRFDYWLVYPNEILHRRGLLGNVSRYPAPGLELQKEITDIFEYFLFGSGRLIIQPSKGPPIVLDTVFRVNDKVDRIQDLLDAISVEVTAPEPASRGAPIR
jgi:hypothetical protein